jgi:hypothetical protein
MAESGCLRDVQVNNLEVTGTTEFKGTVLGKRRNVITVTGASGSDVARVLKENESGSLVLVNNSASDGAGDNTQITLPLAGDVSTAETITPGLEFEIILTHTPGDAGALVEISTGDDAVNFNALTIFKGGNDALNVNVAGSRGHSKLILTPDTVAEALDTRIVCRSITTTLWDIRCEEPAATLSNLTSAAGAAFA